LDEVGAVVDVANGLLVILGGTLNGGVLLGPLLSLLLTSFVELLEAKYGFPSVAVLLGGGTDGIGLDDDFAVCSVDSDVLVGLLAVVVEPKGFVVVLGGTLNVEDVFAEDLKGFVVVLDDDDVGGVDVCV
jgi:hypothetical protein